MKLRMTSISVIALAAMTGSAALAQSGESGEFCDTGYFQADSNSDGTIDKQELDKVTEAQFSALDANGDGTITRAEYTDCLGDWSQADLERSDMSKADVAAIDANEDGTIDQDEYMEAADQEYMARWGETGTEKEVRDADMAPATPEDMGGPGNEAEATDSAASETEKQASAEDSGSDQSATGATDQKMSETAKDTGADTATGEPKLLLRRIIFLPDPDQRMLGDMSRDEVAHRAALQFMVLDLDGNKLIEPDEQTGQASEEQANVDDTLNQQFDRADTDKSGDLSREEYTADSEARWEQAQDRGESASADDATTDEDVGAPVVYFRYPHTM